MPDGDDPGWASGFARPEAWRAARRGSGAGRFGGSSSSHRRLSERRSRRPRIMTGETRGGLDTFAAPLATSRRMRITRRPGEPEPENGLVSASYVDPRDLGPNSPVRDLARAYLP